MQGSIIKRKGKTGTKWAIRFIDQDGERHYKTIGTRRVDAEKALAATIHQINVREYRDVPEITLKEFAAKWLEAHAPTVRPKTHESYRQHIENRILPYFGSRKLRQINAEDVEQFKASLAEEDISASTVGKHLLTLKMILKTAVAWGYLNRSPAEFVKKPRHVKKEFDFLTPNELKQLITATHEKHRALIITACYTGMRRGELLGLKWGDIEFIQSRIFVRRTLQSERFYEPKTASSRRSISVPQQVIAALKEHQARQAVELMENELELVFPNEVGKPMDGQNLSHRIFLPALKRAGLRQVRFHDLRHSYASALISAGENVKWIQKQLGHSSIQVTMDIYGHLLPEVERDASRRLETALSASY